jgi:hypothetical protein
MELFKNIRLGIGQRLLNKKIIKTRRKVSYSGIDTVKKIGIVWDASQLSDFNCLSRFYQKMHERNVEVTIMGYFPGKALPDQYTAIRYLTCIRREELNYFYHPVSAESNNFINNRFDVLIDINFRNILPLLYVTSLSNAAFKVGLSDPQGNQSLFDLMMELKCPVEVDNYLTQSLHYLEMINSKEVKPI